MLEINQLAPDFTLPNQNGELRTLSDYKGKWVVLYFYPKDNTPGCTTQACSYRDNMNEFEKKGIKVFGLSKDTAQSKKKFEVKYELNFELLADEDHHVLEAYDVWKEKNMYGKKVWGIKRTTFVVNPEGQISAIFEKVKPDEDVAQVLAAIENA